MLKTQVRNAGNGWVRRCDCLWVGWQPSSASICLQDREYKWGQNLLEGAYEGENCTWNNSFVLEPLVLAEAMHISYLVTQKSQLTSFLVIFRKYNSVFIFSSLFQTCFSSSNHNPNSIYSTLTHMNF